MSDYPSDADAARLLAHVMSANTRWFKMSTWLLETGRRGVPEHRDSRNPIKWSLAQAGLVMHEIQRKHINRKLDRAALTGEADDE